MSLSVAPVRLWVSLRMTELLDTVISVKSKVDERHQNRQQENKNSTARAFVIIDDRILYIFEHNTLVLDESCRNLSCAHVQEIGSEIFRHLFAYFCRKKAKVLIKTSFWIKSSVHCHVSLRCCRLIESKYRHWSERSFFHTFKRIDMSEFRVCKFGSDFRPQNQPNKDHTAIGTQFICQFVVRFLVWMSQRFCNFGDMVEHHAIASRLDNDSVRHRMKQHH